MSGQRKDGPPELEAMRHALMIFNNELDNWERTTGEVLFHAAENKVGLGRGVSRGLLATVYLERWEKMQLQYSNLQSLYEAYQKKADAVADLLVKLNENKSA